MKIIKTKKAPQAIGPYSQAIVSEGLIFTSGQIGINPELGKLENKNFELEARQVFKNIEFLLIQSGSGLSNIIKLNIFLIDLSNFDILNKIMKEVLDIDRLPSRSTVQVSALPKGASIEIDAIAEVVK